MKLQILNKIILKLVLCIFFSFLNSCIEVKKETSAIEKNKIEELKIDFLIDNRLDTIKNTKKKERKVDTICFSDFKHFFDKFSKDSIFQKQRITFPLKKVIYDYYESNDPKIELISKDSFSFFNFDKDQKAINHQSNKYTAAFEQLENCEIVYKLRGYDNGINIRFKFRKNNDKWLLFEIIDEST